MLSAGDSRNCTAETVFIIADERRGRAVSGTPLIIIIAAR